MLTDLEKSAADRFAARFGLDAGCVRKGPWMRAACGGRAGYRRLAAIAHAGPPAMHTVVDQTVRVDGQGCGFDVLLASLDEAHDTHAEARKYVAKCLDAYLASDGFADAAVDCDPTPDPYRWVIARRIPSGLAQVAYVDEATARESAEVVARQSGMPVLLMPLRALTPIVVEPAPRGFKFLPTNPSGESDR